MKEGGNMKERTYVMFINSKTCGTRLFVQAKNKRLGQMNGIAKYNCTFNQPGDKIIDTKIKFMGWFDKKYFKENFNLE